jgi:hypothetical protein
MARLLFVGLWTLADRDGRIECRPLRIKAELFPYDNCDIVALLEQLRVRGFVRSYDAGGVRYIDIPGFVANQRVHPKEQSEGHPAWGDCENVDFHGEKCNATASHGKPRQNSGAPVANRSLPSLPSLPSIPSLINTHHAGEGEAGRLLAKWEPFVNAWNRAKGVEPYAHIGAPPPDFLQRAEELGWDEIWPAALQRLARAGYFDRPCSLTQFVKAGFAHRIAAGEFDSKAKPKGGRAVDAPMTLDEKLARDRKESRTKPAWRAAPAGCPDDLAGRFFNQMLSQDQFEENLKQAKGIAATRNGGTPAGTESQKRPTTPQKQTAS